MPEYKSSSSSRVLLIEDGVLKFFHVVNEEETSCDSCHLIFIERFGCVHVSMGVHWVLLILVILIDESRPRGR